MDKKQKQIIVLAAILAVVISVGITIYTEYRSPDMTLENTMVFVFVEMILLSVPIWIYLSRSTTVSTRWVMRITVGIALLPMSAMFITDLALHKETKVIWYLVYAALPVMGFLFGDSKASDEAIRKTDQKRNIASKVKTHATGNKSDKTKS